MPKSICPNSSQKRWHALAQPATSYIMYWKWPIFSEGLVNYQAVLIWPCSLSPCDFGGQRVGETTAVLPGERWCSGNSRGGHLWSARIVTVGWRVPIYSGIYTIYIMYSPDTIYIYSPDIPYYFIPIYNYIQYIRRKFRSQTSDNTERWKAEQGRGREKRKIRREKIRRERVRRQKIQMREKVGKSRFTVFFQWFGAPEGRKVGSLKRRVRSQLARWEMKNCTPLWREAHLEVKMYKTHQRRTTFGSWDVEKVHAVVARSTFPSQNVQNTSATDHFWKLRCRKSARRCGAKHISKSKCTKH